MIAKVGSFMARRKPGFDWYVDSVHGDDSYSGKSSARPLKTIAGVLGQPIRSGQQIGLAAGSSWREQLIIPTANVTVAAYGAGPKPLLDCSEAIAAGAWAKTPVQTSVYQSNVPLDWDIGKTFVSVWEDGARLVRATSVANCDATPGSYFPSAESTSPITLYVHAADHSNPSSNGKLYEYSRRRHGLDPSAHPGCTFRGIWTRRNAHQDGSLLCADRNYDCLATEGSYHNIYLGPGCYLENVEAL